MKGTVVDTSLQVFCCADLQVNIGDRQEVGTKGGALCAWWWMRVSRLSRTQKYVTLSTTEATVCGAC